MKLSGAAGIAPLLKNEKLVVYLDFDSTKNGFETLEYLIMKIKRLDNMGYSKSQILNIIIEGDNLQQCFLNKTHYCLLINFIKENIATICSSNKNS